MVFATLLLLAATGCTKPVLNLTDQAVPEAARSLSDAEMERQIRLAGAPLGWEFEKIAPGALRGTLNVRTHTAVVDVLYNSSEYDITLHSSTNLQQANGEIHHNYNRWVTNLRDKIRDRLQTAGQQTK